MEETPIGDPNSNGYEVDLPDFQGPLDLLLSLIEQEELDITKISLARVTDQYLARLEILKETDPDDLTDFLVIAVSPAVDALQEIQGNRHPPARY
jgi:segregation and condensation protein A